MGNIFTETPSSELQTEETEETPKWMAKSDSKWMALAGDFANARPSLLSNVTTCHERTNDDASMIRWPCTRLEPRDVAVSFDIGRLDAQILVVIVGQVYTC